jgi:putative phosphoesterase
VKVVVLADTHLRPGGKRGLPPAVYAALVDAGAVLHAGDVVTGHLLDELRGRAPLTAVLGNNDTELAGRLPVTRTVELGGVRVGLIHDSGDRRGRAGRLNRRFPDCAVVVFGHSHVPVNELGVGGQRLFNPGSATYPRSQPRPTFGLLECEGGELRSAQIVAV